MVLDSFVCNNEDHPGTLRRESYITGVELAALHHELAVYPLRWFGDFAIDRSFDVSRRKLETLLLER